MHRCENEVLGAINAGILVFSRDGTVTLANPRACQILPHTGDTLLGLNVASLLAPVAELVQAAQDNRRIECSVANATCIGASVAPIPSAAGEPDRFVCLFQDISELRQLQLERNKLLQLGALHSVFPAVLHELRNPVAAIQSTLEVLCEEADGSMQEALHALLGEIRRMHVNLHGVAAVGLDLRAPTCAAIDLTLSDLMRVLETKAQRKEVLLHTDIDTMPLLPLDPVVVRGLAFNLVDNALEASPKGATVRVTARFEASTRTFDLSVRDEGAGMSPEVLARATELFFTTRRHGSGLGLALVHRAVTAAGGTLTLDSRPGEGTLARIVIGDITSSARR